MYSRVLAGGTRTILSILSLVPLLLAVLLSISKPVPFVLAIRFEYTSSVLLSTHSAFEYFEICTLNTERTIGAQANENTLEDRGHVLFYSRHG